MHRLGVGEGHRERRADAAGGADGAKKVGAFIALVGGLLRPRPALGPLAHKPVLLPNARFVLEPDFDRRAVRHIGEMRAQRSREVFLYASTIRPSCAKGYLKLSLVSRGRALMWEKPSFLRSLPT